MTTRNILVVDDEPHIVKTCARFLELKGFETKGVLSGTEAIDLYKNRHFDLALIDLQLPDISGLEVLKALKAYDPAATVVIFTAHNTKENIAQAQKLGVSEFLEKPVDANVLFATVQRLLE